MALCCCQTSVTHKITHASVRRTVARVESRNQLIKYQLLYVHRDTYALDTCRQRVRANNNNNNVHELLLSLSALFSNRLQKHGEEET